MSGWQRSPFCGAGNCVETLRQVDGSVLVRNSSDRTVFVQFDADEWAAHEAGIRDSLSEKNRLQGLHMARLENALVHAQMEITRLLAKDAS
jgi:hypothetical protein